MTTPREPHGPPYTVALMLAAQRLGKSYGVARDMVLTGKLDGKRFSDGWYVTQDSIDSHLENTHA